MKIGTIIADVMAVMAILAWYDSKRFFVFVRVLSGIIFLGFSTYVLHELYLFLFEGKPFVANGIGPGSSLAKSLVGFTIFGIPAFIIAVRGTFAIKKKGPRTKI